MGATRLGSEAHSKAVHGIHEARALVALAAARIESLSETDADVTLALDVAHRILGDAMDQVDRLAVGSIEATAPKTAEAAQ